MTPWGHWWCFPVEVPADFFRRQLSPWPLNTVYSRQMCASVYLDVHSPQSLSGSISPSHILRFLHSLSTFCGLLLHWFINILHNFIQSTVLPLTHSFTHHWPSCTHRLTLTSGAVCGSVSCSHGQEELESNPSNPAISRRPSIRLHLFLTSPLSYSSLSRLLPSFLLPRLLFPFTLFIVLSSCLVLCILFSYSQLSSPQLSIFHLSSPLLSPSMPVISLWSSCDSPSFLFFPLISSSLSFLYMFLPFFLFCPSVLSPPHLIILPSLHPVYPIVMAFLSPLAFIFFVLSLPTLQFFLSIISPAYLEHLTSLYCMYIL